MVIQVLEVTRANSENSQYAAAQHGLRLRSRQHWPHLRLNPATKIPGPRGIATSLLQFRATAY